MSKVVPEPESAPWTRAVRYSRAVAEQDDRFAVALESILAILRSPRLDDRAARALATESAALTLVDLRDARDRQQTELLEPVVGAFAQLRGELRPLERFGELAVEFIDPPATGRALPGEIAREARAIVRSAVLALIEGAAPRRIRIQWDCDGLNLLVNIRDDGRGALTVRDDAVRPIAERVGALDGALSVSSTSGWGSEVAVRIPLDPPREPDSIDDSVPLTDREREVLRHVAGGARNQAIAAALGISVNTVKYHVGNILRKAGVASRAELVLLTRSHGARASR